MAVEDVKGVDGHCAGVKGDEEAGRGAVAGEVRLFGCWRRRRERSSKGDGERWTGDDVRTAVGSWRSW